MRMRCWRTIAAQEAVAILEKDREPQRADLELALARAYAGVGDAAKAAAILHNIYFTLPMSPEAGPADAELKALSGNAQLPPPTFTERKTRADLLFKGRRYSEAADEYRESGKPR